jgi:peptide/nickel transport system permease protein
VSALPLTRRQQVGRSIIVRGAFHSWPGLLGALLVGMVVAVAVLGPIFSPHLSGDIVGTSYQPPGPGHRLGTDGLGRDVLSRYLNGGRTLLIVAFSATVLAYAIGIAAGLAAGFAKGRSDLVAVWAVDVLLAFPPIVLVLTLIAVAGSSLTVAVLGIAAVHAPRVFRIARSVTLGIATQEYVEAAVARGERFGAVLRREVLPNIWTPVLADFGIRLAGSVILYASLSYLGFGTPPPTPDWASMISDDRLGLTIQPWVVVAPAITIALLAIGVSLLADSIARASGRSLLSRDA